MTSQNILTNYLVNTSLYLYFHNLSLIFLILRLYFLLIWLQATLSNAHGLLLALCSGITPVKTIWIAGIKLGLAACKQAPYPLNYLLSTQES